MSGTPTGRLVIDFETDSFREPMATDRGKPDVIVVSTPTGRFPSQAETQHFKPHLVESDILVIHGGDYSDLEARVLAWSLTEDAGKVLGEINEAMRQACGISDAMLNGLDPWRTTAAEAIARIESTEKKAQVRPAKSYLRHDPTKNHRKVRR